MSTFLRVDRKTKDFELNDTKPSLHLSYSSFIHGCNFHLSMSFSYT